MSLSKNFIIDPFKSMFIDQSISLDVIFFSTLIILLPIALITGPALPDIFLSLIAIYFLIFSIWKNKWSYYQNVIVYGFLCFSLFGIIRSLFSEMPIESLVNEGSIFYFRYIFFAMGVWYLLDNNPYLLKCLMFVSIICILVVSIDGIYQYITGFNFLGYGKHSENRLTGLFGDEPIIGRYIAYLTLITFTLIYQNFKKTKKMIILSVLFLVISEVIVFLSGERAPLFYLILFSFFLLIFNSKFRIYRLIGVFITIIIIFAVTLFNHNAKTRIIDLTIKQVSKTYLPFLPYSDHHQEHYVSGLKMFIDKPLFGVGTNLFRYHCSQEAYRFKERSCSSHPHHYYIQLLAELGIFGFLILLTFFLYLSSFILKQIFYFFKSDTKKKIPFNFLLYPVILFIYWWPLIPHMSIYNNWNNVLMMLPLGFFMKYLYGNSNGNFYKI